MEQLVEEFGHATFTPFPVVVARLLLAAVFGAKRLTELPADYL